MNDARALEVGLEAALGRELSPASDTDVNVKLLVLSNLMAAKPDLALPALQNVLNSKNPSAVKDRALFVLAQNPTPEARRILGSAAQDRSDPALRANAIRYVGMLGGDDGRKELVSLYRTSSDDQTKRAVLQSLAFAGSDRFLLETAKAEARPALRSAAIQSLGLVGSNDKADALVAMFARESDAGVRNSILKALVMGNNSKALIQLERHESDPQRKAEIIRYLSFLRPDEAARHQVDLVLRK